MITETAAAKPPHLLFRIGEIFALQEYATFLAMQDYFTLLPKGDGHPVLFLPGFMAGDDSTRPMRTVLKRLGYDVYGWRLGRNIEINDDRIEQMLAVLSDIYERTGQKVSLVGWSLGGIIAREIAKVMPEKVRFVISLGSPISNDPGYSAANPLFERVNAKDQRISTATMGQDLETPPPVPTTSIYSKTDGVVSWRSSIQADGHKTENIEVRGTHCGLGYNPAVIIAIADRLKQNDGDWVAFSPSFCNFALFP